MITKQKKLATVDETGNVRPSMAKSIFAFVLFILYMIPFLLVVVNSLKTKISIVKYPLKLVDDKGLQFANYANAFEDMDFLQAFGNSIFVVALSVLLLMVFSSMCAYILVRKNYLACKVSFLLLISYMVVPFQVIMIPLLALYGGTFNMLNSRLTLVLMNFGFGTCFAVFLCHGFIKTSVPLALEEAALIDGCGPDRRGLTRHVFPDIIQPLLAGDDSRDMRIFGRAALLTERIVGQHERGAGRQHRIDQQQDLVFEVAARNILYLNGELTVFRTFAVSRNERVLRIVEVIQKPLMVGKTGAQNRRHDDPVVDRLDGRFAQRSLDHAGRIGQLFRNLVRRDFADTLQIAAETHRVGLDRLVADLRDEFVEDGVLTVQSMQGHMGMRFGGQ